MGYFSVIDALQLEVDLRVVDQERRARDLLAMFAALRPGDGFVFVIDQEPVGLLAELQSKHWGTFEWYPLDERPRCWRVALMKRPPPAGLARRMDEFMDADHQRIEQMLLRLEDLVLREQWVRARQFGRFISTGIRHHMIMEEQLLFPVLSQRVSFFREQEEAGFLAAHRQILAALEQLRTMLRELTSSVLAEEAPAADVIRRLIRRAGELRRHFEKHRQEEERYVYMTTDLLLNAQEVDQLVRRCQALSAEQVRRAFSQRSSSPSSAEEQLV